MPRFLSKLIDRLSEREVVDPEVRQAFQQAMDLEGCIRLLLPEAGLHEQGIRVWRAGSDLLERRILHDRHAVRWA